MKQIKMRWDELGLPTRPGNYRHGLYDIDLANGNPDAVFTAIRPEFFSAETPYIITHVEFPGQVIGS